MSRATKLLLSILIFALSVTAEPQSENRKIASVAEPPEFLFEPEAITKPLQIDEDFEKAVQHLGDTRDPEANAVASHNLDTFITEHPDYPDAYAMRIMAVTCEAPTVDFVAALADVEKAIAGQSVNSSGYHFATTAELYALRARVKIRLGQYATVLDDLEFATKQDVSSASNIYQLQGTAPSVTSKPCDWNLTDFDALVSRFPSDYRAFIFRGTYYQFFTTYNEASYAKAMSQFQRAAELNPRSPLPSFFLGEVQTKHAFWSPRAAASDSVRDAENRKALDAYTSAIQKDSKFVPGYAARAEAYYSLKSLPQAIKDYNRVLERDPENKSAHSDRGVAYLESRHYEAALSDFRDQLRDKKSGGDFLPFLYEYMGDADFALGQYSAAVVDFSHAIERRFSTQVLLLSLPQMRAIYPEFGFISDDSLLHKLHAHFFPGMDYALFLRQEGKADGKWSPSMLNDLYEKRGDSYLKSHNYPLGVRDFQRIFRGIPTFADVTERWREIAIGADGDHYLLDVKTAEFSDTESDVRMWIKGTSKTKSETTAYEVVCGKRSLRANSTTIYDANGKVTGGSQFAGSWDQVIPDSIGESFYLGACPNDH